MDHDLGIGDRIRHYRMRRGVSQAVLAGLVGRSESWLSQVERGRMPLDRISVAAAVADVLHVKLEQLLGLPVPLVNGDGEGIPGIRKALTSAALGPPAAEPVDLDVFAADVEAGWRERQAARYGEVAARLPDLIRRAEDGIAAPDGDARRAWALASSAYQLSASVLCRPGETDLAWIAADRAVRAADQADDEVLMGAAAWKLAHVLRSAGRYDEATTVIQIAADRLDPAAGAAHTSVWGALHLFGAITRACDNDIGEAWRMHQAAETAAERLGGDRNDCWTTFGPAQVGGHRVAVSVELGQPGEALRFAERTDVSAFPEAWAQRRARYLIDVAQAHWQRRADAAAVNVLLNAERAAPEEARYQPVFREMVVDLLRRERRHATPELRPLAQRIGVLD